MLYQQLSGLHESNVKFKIVCDYLNDQGTFFKNQKHLTFGKSVKIHTIVGVRMTLVVQGGN